MSGSVDRRATCWLTILDECRLTCTSRLSSLLGLTLADLDMEIGRVTIQALLGHSDLRMTMRYIKLAEQQGVDEEKLAKSPLDQVRWR